LKEIENWWGAGDHLGSIFILLMTTNSLMGVVTCPRSHYQSMAEPEITVPRIQRELRSLYFIIIPTIPFHKALHFAAHE
jgi:hypothetical protein